MVVVVVACTVAYVIVRDDDDTTFCDTALRIRQVQLSPTETMTVVLQDQGAPGPDGCDLEQFGYPGDDPNSVLAYDCQIRSVAGAVLGSAPANRSDDTCGQDP